MVLSRSLVAETLGTAFLLAAIVGSGIMAERLAGGNVAIALLCNSLATGAMLVVLITILGPISGAHLNPAVTLAFFSQTLHHERSRRSLCLLPDCWWGLSHMGRAPQVWERDLPSLDHSTRGTGPLVRGGCGDLRAHPGYPWHTSVENGQRPHGRRPLHHLGLLVYRLDELC